MKACDRESRANSSKHPTAARTSAVSQKHTFASVVTVGLGGKCTSVAFKMVFS